MGEDLTESGFDHFRKWFEVDTWYTLLHGAHLSGTVEDVTNSSGTIS